MENKYITYQCQCLYGSMRIMKEKETEWFSKNILSLLQHSIVIPKFRHEVRCRNKHVCLYAGIVV